MRKWSVFVLMLFLWLSNIACRDQSPDAVTLRIRRSAELSAAEKCLDGLPKPKGYSFFYRLDYGNHRESGLSYYIGADGDLNELRQFYDSQLLSQGWKRNDYADFVKGNQEIFIMTSPDPVAKFSIACVILR